ncbi:hypothetical protein FJW06_23355 [Mesorhizobium sp. B4-1-3]|uniref:hypothetical protein n=1 Tax=Mesorhizobium sp. B4-1-3 TaxID=2589889 RepID=UPI0011293178|nr:hypothetical protein [Mesorhizobium sp. B4-1-3]TPI10287.1 hypothetical protein FJW06_23355 [Mesorhizobium sp. B4-1-3]
MIFFADNENFFSYAYNSQEELDDLPSIVSGMRTGKRTNGRPDASGLCSTCAAAQYGVRNNDINQLFISDKLAAAACFCRACEMDHLNDRP